MLRIIATLFAGVLLCAQTPMLPGFPPGTFQNRAALDAAAAGGGPSLALIGGVTDTGSGNAAITLTGDIGTATATRVILIAANRQNSGGFSGGVTVNGQAASILQASATNVSQFWVLVGAAAGSGAQNIVLTGGTFELRSARAWVMDGLASTTKVQSSAAAAANSIGSISLLTGDYWFANAQTLSGTRNWSSSTPTPTNSYDDSAGGGTSAQWAIGSNVTGTAAVSGGTTELTQVSFR